MEPLTILNNPTIAALPILPWIGGKRRLAKHLLPLFGLHDCYVEPFCGAAALFFMKAPAKAEVINDINGDLINLYRVIQHHLDEFGRQFRWSLVSRQLWQWLDATPPQTLTDIQRAVRFFYLQKCGFGGKVMGRTFGTSTTTGPRINLLRIEEDLSQAHLRLSSVTMRKRRRRTLRRRRLRRDRVRRRRLRPRRGLRRPPTSSIRRPGPMAGSRWP